MRIADVCRQDTGGQSWKLARAINETTRHECRSFRSTPDYLEIPVDVHRNTAKKDKAKWRWVNEYFASSDVVHCHSYWKTMNGWPRAPKAKWLFHQHGRPGTLWEPWLKIDKARGALRCISTLNLMRYVKNDPTLWIPAAFDLARMDAIKAKHWKGIRRRGGRILVAHSPTRRDYKGTEYIIASVKQLQGEGLNVHLVLMEQMPNRSVLAKRSACDITYDQMHLCYGNSGLEGMSFGQPTIVGMSDTTRSHINNYIGYEPFVYADKSTLTRVLRKLVVDADHRRHWGEVARKYMEDWHEHGKVAARVIGLYERIGKR